MGGGTPPNPETLTFGFGPEGETGGAWFVLRDSKDNSSGECGYHWATPCDLR
jgi:hypothetical protein